MKMVDAHVHFWNPATLAYPWLRARPALDRAFLPRDFDALARGALDAVLFVEGNCVPTTAEIELDFVETLRVSEPRIAGSVAFVDLYDDRHSAGTLRRLADRPDVVGIRHNIQGQSAGSCLTARFVAGVAAVGAQGFPFDLCITADQLGEATELVRRCPGTQFVLDHCGKPAIRDDAFAPWARGIRELARLANVACKLSGLFTEARPEQRTAAALHPYVEHVRECFGPTRMLYGSDWPVVSIAGGEERWRETMQELACAWPSDDRALLFAANATRLYPRAAHVLH